MNAFWEGFLLSAACLGPVVIVAYVYYWGSRL
jgi:hypothetical protein